jgi:DMSO/TMAO reductase YedYZ molybdopterin-dependent catalytic subunit
MRIVVLSLIASLTLLAPHARAEQSGAPSTSVTVSGPSGRPVAIDLEALARLPIQQVTVTFRSAQGSRTVTFAGPLLWNVLEQTKAVDPVQHQNQVSQIVVLVGRDGYRAVLALAELAPEFEGKQVILAQQMDGQPLGVEHLRVVVPVDKRGGRSVRDIARIEVMPLP